MLAFSLADWAPVCRFNKCYLWSGDVIPGSSLQVWPLIRLPQTKQSQSIWNVSEKPVCIDDVIWIQSLQLCLAVNHGMPAPFITSLKLPKYNNQSTIQGGIRQFLVSTNFSLVSITDWGPVQPSTRSSAEPAAHYTLLHSSIPLLLRGVFAWHPFWSVCEPKWWQWWGRGGLGRSLK